MINATYYDRGFLSVAVAAPRIMLTPDRSGIEITITITEGPQYKIRQLRIFERDASGREVEPIGGRGPPRAGLRRQRGGGFTPPPAPEGPPAGSARVRDPDDAHTAAHPRTRR